MGLFVAVIFLFAILSAREAAIVVFTVISPVAFVCYALPNTKNLFDKWFKIGKGLLLVYPICGLLMGGGNYVSRLLLVTAGGENFLNAFMAIIVGIVPIFFIPTVLKGSFAALGNLGAKISGLGDKLGRRGQDAIRGSERYKNFQQFSRDQGEARRAARIINRLGRRRSNLSLRQQDRLAKAQDTYKNWQKGLLENNVNTRDDSQLTAALTQQRMEVEENARDLALYNDANYQIGKGHQRDVNRLEDRLKATAYADSDYVSGKRVQAALNSDNEYEGALLYTRPGFGRFKQDQFRAQRQNEIRKGYSEQYDKMSASARQAELSSALSGSGPDAVERLDAAFSSLLDKGDMTEILDAFNGADFAAMNPALRDRAVALAAGSGDSLLKGWAKSGGTQSLQNYINNTGANGLKQYLSTQAGNHAFDTASKDTLKFLASHGGANAMSDEMLHNIITTSANTNQAATDAAIQLLAGREAAVGNITNADSLTKMNGAIANAIGAANLSGAIAEIRQPNNSQLLAKVSGPVKTALGL